jgi:ornithine carbamoyltransferase
MLSRLPRHFLTGAELSPEDLHELLGRALELKADPLASRALADRHVALLFEKPSTRTRVSFEVGVVELGGHPLVLRADEMQLSRGESPRDTALVLSRQVHAVGLRTGDHALIEELAAHSEVPVFNMLTSSHHPCQALGDLMTLREALGTLEEVKLAYVGDGNNVARSLARLGAAAGVAVTVSSPEGYRLEPQAGAELVDDPAEAVAGAHAVYTDVWVSMGDEAEEAARRKAFAGFTVTPDLVPDGAIFLHDLPAHRGDEVVDEVMDGPQSRVWDQAENRLHAQKALLAFLLGAAP